MNLSNRHESPQSRRPRLLALPLVLMCALAYLGSAAHFVLVQHSTCVEHGGLVHGDEVEQGGEHAAEQVRASYKDERFTRASATAAEVHGADEHCVHVFLRRVAPPPAGVMVSAEAPVESGQVLVADRVFVEPPVAWLHLAPKSSPPRA